MERAEKRFMQNINTEKTGDDEFNEHIATQWKGLQIKEANFGDIYDVEELEADQKKKQGIRESFEDKEPEIARGLHMSIMQGIDQYDWLGPDANVVFTSEYDDVINGTDFVVCFTQDNSESIKIAIDVTTSASREVLKKKITRIIKQLQSTGHMKSLKYFEYVDADFENEPRGSVAMPRIILGTDAYNARKLMKSFSTAIAQKGVDGKKAREELGKEHIQYELLNEMMAQLCLQLEASVDVYKYRKAEDSPDSANGILNWISEWQVLENKGMIPEELREKLAMEMDDLFRAGHEEKGNYLESAYEIAKTILYIHELQQKKGAEHQSSADKDITATQLSHPEKLVA